MSWLEKDIPNESPYHLELALFPQFAHGLIDGVQDILDYFKKNGFENENISSKYVAV